jgi:hypothetical protein
LPTDNAPDCDPEYSELTHLNLKLRVFSKVFVLVIISRV